ncbi:hypothetical protein E4K72_05385 [Oxalobacteraceae bacterium OM1]|nr:hypothetical protein E4K72_05385 [Oxalobacteraceae bacterium OM1]
MKKTIILETLVLAAVLAASPAKATPLPLQGAKITATYNGSAAGMLGFDSGYSGGPGSNITGLDPSDISVEFLTSDFLFGFDFAEDGMLTVYNNDTIPFGSYSIVFDFGSSLSQAITSFTLADRNAIGGMPALSLINSHAIGLDLSNVT